MSEQVSGSVEAITGPNKGGYYSIKVNGVWHGIGKEAPAFQKGASVTFNAYLKDSKYSTVKGPITIATVTVAATPVPANVPAPRGGSQQNDYWRKREAGDEAREQRIGFFAAYERALGFVRLALERDAFPKLEKAKAADKLDVLRAFVLEETNKLVALSSGAPAPAAPVATEQTQAALAQLENKEEWE